MRLQEGPVQSDAPSAPPRRISAAGRVLTLVGAAMIALGAVLPWVVVEGVPLKLDWLDVRVPVSGREVSGTDTLLWPVLLGLAAVLAALGLFARAWRVLLGLGLLALVGAGALMYYLRNVIEIETSGRSALEQTLAEVAVRAPVQSGPYLLLVGALFTVAGALTRR